MTRRVRRDLSDKRIKKIVKGKYQTGSQPGISFPKPTSSLLTILKPFFYFFIFVLFIFLTYHFIHSVDFNELFLSSDSTVTEQQKLDTLKEIATDKEQASEEQEIPEEPVVQPVKQKSQIEVLNGCGVSGIAKNTMIYLRKVDFDVVYMGNYKNFDVTNSMVIDRIGKKEIALKIAGLLGIPPNQVKTEIDQSIQVDASIILGKDYTTLTPFQEQ